MQGGDSHALIDADLEIEQGEIFGVIGRSGAGKSTLVRCINFLERPSSGEVIFDGVRLSSLSSKELYQTRQSMGMIFQQFNLLAQRTALRNVCFPLEIAGWDKHKARGRAHELLELVGMGDKVGSYPAQLSGGQCQRVAIARAIALQPRILLCDEATSALDPETTRGVLALLADINERYGITIILITHEMAVVDRIASRLAVLDEGRIVEVGSVAEVFAAPKSEAARQLLARPEDGLVAAAARNYFERHGLELEDVIRDYV
jgi:D-methionine transport system ATP-binding protein